MHWGYNSSDAEIDWSAEEKTFKSTVTVRGTQIAHITLSLSATEANPQLPKDIIHFNKIGGGSYMVTMHEEEHKRIPGELDKANLFGFEVDKVLLGIYREYDWVLFPGLETLEINGS